MRRFYETVEVRSIRDGFELTLDDKPLRTPAKAPLAVASRPLAEAIAEEWRTQGESLDFHEMRLTKLANTALDRIAPDPQPTIDELTGYAETDLICYRADAPPDLVSEQSRCWDPLIDWVEEHHGARLEATVGVVPRAQAPSAVGAIQNALSVQEPMVIAAIHTATTVSGSVVVALALNAGRLDGEQAFVVSQLDETHQIAQWGDDSEAAERRAGLRREMLAAERFLRLIRA